MKKHHRKPDYYYRVYLHPVIDHLKVASPKFRLKKNAKDYATFLQGLSFNIDTTSVRKIKRRR